MWLWLKIEILDASFTQRRQENSGATYNTLNIYHTLYKFQITLIAQTRPPNEWRCAVRGI